MVPIHGPSTYQIVQFNRCDALVHARDDLLGDGSSIDVLGVEPIAKPGDTSGDLVELYAFFSSI